MNFLNAASMFSSQFNNNQTENKSSSTSQTQNVLETLAPVVGSMMAQNQQNTSKDSVEKEDPPPQQQNVYETIAPVAAALAQSYAGGDNKEISDNTKSSQQNLFQTIAPMLNLLPQEQKKNTIFEHIGPVIKAISPKWGDVIIVILKQLDLQKLLDLIKDDSALEERVKKEEEKLEEGKD